MTIIERGKVLVREKGGEWKEVSLVEFFKVKHGFAFKSEFFPTNLSRAYWLLREISLLEVDSKM